MTRAFYPALLDIKGKACVIVGGGKVAERKAKDILKAGGKLTVVSPELTPALAKLALSGKLKHKPRRYKPSDTAKAFIVIAATDDPAVNKKVGMEAPRTAIVNIADQPERSGFIVPSRIVRGPLIIAISTSGASPAVAAAIRRDIEKRYTSEVGREIAKLAELRKRAMREIKDPVERAKHLRSLAEGRIIKKLRAER